MTPKEKAEYLVAKFYVVHPIVRTGTAQQKKEKTEIKVYDKAKQAAIIAVDEILKEVMGKAAVCNSEKCSYWQQVKEEINKIII